VTSILPVLFVLAAAGAEPTAAEPADNLPAPPAPPAQGRTIEIVIAGPEHGRSKLEETIRPLLGDAADLRWSAKDRLPVDEALPAAKSEGGVHVWQIWIDLGNPVQLRIYLPTQTADGATTVRTVERPTGEDAEWVVRETAAQIVKAAVQALRGDAAKPLAEPAHVPSEMPAADFSPPSTTAATVAARPASTGPKGPRWFGFVLAGGAHTSPLNLGESTGEKNWLGPSVVAQVRWQRDKVLLAFRMSWEDSDRKANAYYLKNTYFTGTVAASRFVDAGIVSFGIGLEAGLLVLHQNTWQNVDWQGSWGAMSLPGQTGKTNSMGALFGPVAELNLSPTPNLFVHFAFGIPIAVLHTKDEMGSQWEASPFFRATVGAGFRL